MSKWLQCGGGRGQLKVHAWSYDKGLVLSKMSTIVHSRGERGQNWVKVCPGSCWTPPYSIFCWVSFEHALRLDFLDICTTQAHTIVPLMILPWILDGAGNNFSLFFLGCQAGWQEGSFTTTRVYCKPSRPQRRLLMELVLRQDLIYLSTWLVIAQFILEEIYFSLLEDSKTIIRVRQRKFLYRWNKFVGTSIVQFFSRCKFEIVESIKTWPHWKNFKFCSSATYHSDSHFEAQMYFSLLKIWGWEKKLKSIFDWLRKLKMHDQY